MKFDIEYAVLTIIAVLMVVAVIAFISKQSDKINDCAKRGGHAVDTSQGWVCAKLEKV